MQKWRSLWRWAVVLGVGGMATLLAPVLHAAVEAPSALAHMGVYGGGLLALDDQAWEVWRRTATLGVQGQLPWEVYGVMGGMIGVAAWAMFRR
jgi:hypothetical protein